MEMSGISVKIWELSEHGKLPKNFPKNCFKRLCSIIPLVPYANYFMLFITDCCLLMFLFLICISVL